MLVYTSYWVECMSKQEQKIHLQYLNFRESRWLLMFLAFKEMIKSKGRFALIISIVILISYLVFFLTGLANGLAQANRTSIDLWQAEEIVLSEGSKGNIQASLMERDILEELDEDIASPINVAPSVAYINGEKEEETTINVVLMGVDYESKIAPKKIEGDLPMNPDEVLASISMKEEEGISLGDTIVLSQNERKFKIVGFAQSAKLNTSPVIYTDLNMASQEMMMFSPKDGAEQITSPTPNMPKRISGVVLSQDLDKDLGEDYEVLTIDEFIDNVPGYVAQVLTFGLMIGFLILISAIVLGIFNYIITIQKKEIYGIMKIQGISNGYIIRSVIFQTFIMSLVGVLIGLGLTMLTSLFLPSAVPFQSNLTYYGAIGGLIIFISVLGAAFSARSVAVIDPLEALE